MNDEPFIPLWEAVANLFQFSSLLLALVLGASHVEAANFITKSRLAQALSHNLNSAFRIFKSRIMRGMPSAPYHVHFIVFTSFTSLRYNKFYCGKKVF